MTVIGERTIPVVVKLEADSQAELDAGFAALQRRLYDVLPAWRLAIGPPVNPRSITVRVLDRYIEPR